MDSKKYRKVRAAIAVFIGVIVAIATTQDSYALAIAGVVTGMIFMALVRSKTKFRTDEREKSVREKAANMTYAIFTPTIGLGSFLLITIGQDTLYLFALGQVLAYLTLYLMAIFAISYYFINRQYGGKEDE